MDLADGSSVRWKGREEGRTCPLSEDVFPRSPISDVSPKRWRQSAELTLLWARITYILPQLREAAGLFDHPHCRRCKGILQILASVHFRLSTFRTNGSGGL